MANGKPFSFVLAELIHCRGQAKICRIAQGLFEKVILLLLAEGSTCRMLISPPSILQSYLSQEAPFERLDQVDIGREQADHAHC